MAPRFAGDQVHGKDNLSYAYKWLTGDGISKYTGGKIKPLSPAGASALLGNWTVETGSSDLTNLDVVEDGNGGAGRGLSQWSHSRRGPYDQARQQWIDGGGDPNDMQFQLQYFADEYIGKHDQAPGKSLIGWTKSVENYGYGDDPTAAAKGFSSSYFRPSEPHLDRRIDAATQIHSQMTAPQPITPTKSVADINLSPTVPGVVKTATVTPTKPTKFQTGRW